MNRIPDFSTLFGDLLDTLFEAIFEYLGVILGWIGELFVSACEAVLGSDSLAVVVPSGLVSAVLVGAGIRLLTGSGTAALFSFATLVVIGLLFAFFELAIVFAILRRNRKR